MPRARARLPTPTDLAEVERGTMTSATATASERSLSSCISGLTGAEAVTVTFTHRVRVKPRASVTGSYLPRPKPWQTRRGPGAALNRAAAAAAGRNRRGPAAAARRRGGRAGRALSAAARARQKLR